MPQDLADEPLATLLQKIRAENRLVEGTIKGWRRWRRLGVSRLGCRRVGVGATLSGDNSSGLESQTGIVSAAPGQF